MPMQILDFLRLREQVKELFGSDDAQFFEDEGAATTVVYVPFGSDGTVLNVAKKIDFEPIAVPFRTYDTDFVRQLSINPVRTYRGDLNSLFDSLNSLRND